VSDTYRTPDSPLGRALAQGRRAEREELDRANRAAVDELRATLAALDPPLAVEVAALDPPLAVEVAQERVSYNSLGADLQVWIVPEPGGSRYHLCALHTAARDLPTVMAYPSTAEAVDRLQADRRREAQQIAAPIASAPRPAEPSPPAAEPPALEPPSAETPVRSLGLGRPTAEPTGRSRVEGLSLAWPAGGAILLGLAALVEGSEAPISRRGAVLATVLIYSGLSVAAWSLFGGVERLLGIDDARNDQVSIAFSVLMGAALLLALISIARTHDAADARAPAVVPGSITCLGSPRLAARLIRIAHQPAVAFAYGALLGFAVTALTSLFLALVSTVTPPEAFFLTLPTMFFGGLYVRSEVKDLHARWLRTMPNEDELLTGAEDAVRGAIERLHRANIATTYVIDDRLVRVHPDGRREELGPVAYERSRRRRPIQRDRGRDARPPARRRDRHRLGLTRGARCATTGGHETRPLLPPPGREARADPDRPGPRRLLRPAGVVRRRPAGLRRKPPPRPPRPWRACGSCRRRPCRPDGSATS
jgi:hypothetical protein